MPQVLKGVRLRNTHEEVSVEAATSRYFQDVNSPHTETEPEPKLSVSMIAHPNGRPFGAPVQLIASNFEEAWVMLNAMAKALEALQEVDTKNQSLAA